MKKEIIYLSTPEEVSMADEWFEIANKDHFWMKWRYEVIETRLRETLDKDIVREKYLEIGCGHGQFMEQLESHFDMSVDGCDLNLFALLKIGETKGNVYVYDIFRRHDSMINKYDVVFLLDVLEHIDDDATFLATALAHVKEGGHVVINVPALSVLFSKYDTRAGHKRRYRKKQIKELFKAAGITPVHIGYWGFLLLPIALLRKFYLLMIPGERIIKSGFAPPSRFLGTLLTLLMKFELFVTGSPFLGTSIVAVGKKGRK